MNAPDKTPETHGEAYDANHNGYRDRLGAFHEKCLQARKSDWYAEYMRKHLPAEEVRS